MLGFMEPIGGKLISINLDVEADSKIKDLRSIIEQIKEVAVLDDDYDTAIRDMVKIVEDIIE